MRRLSDVYEIQRSRDDNQMQMTSYLEEPQDSNPITEALIRLDWLFTTTSSTNKHVAHTHTHIFSFSIALWRLCVSEFLTKYTFQLFKNDNLLTFTLFQILLSFIEHKTLRIIFHVFSSHTIDLCEKKTETEVVIPTIDLKWTTKVVSNLFCYG